MESKITTHSRHLSVLLPGHSSERIATQHFGFFIFVPLFLESVALEEIPTCCHTVAKKLLGQPSRRHKFVRLLISRLHNDVN